jgi:hypothetical protein
MAKARFVGELVVRGIGWLLTSLSTSKQSGAPGSQGPPRDVPGHDFLDRAWGFEREPPSRS